jgi:excisionase family DNA binding protein
MKAIEKLPDIMTPKELAEVLHVNEMTVKRAIYRGDLKGFKVGRDWRIDKKEVIKWLDK